MSKNSNQPVEGGTDLQGLEEFVFSVDTDEVESEYQQDDIKIDTGQDTEEDKNTDEKEESKEDLETEDKTDNKESDKKSEESEKTVEKSEEEKETPPKTNQEDSYYSKLASKFLEKGKWQDAELELEGGKVVKLSELEEMDEDLFFKIEESQSKFSEEDINNNYIKKGDFDENKLKIIEILKEGGDIKDIFATPEEAKRPFDDVDLEDEKNQQSIFFSYLTKVQNLNPEDAKVVLDNHNKRGEIQTKVEEIVNKYQSNYDKKLSDKLEEIKKEKAERQEKDKNFSKSLQEIYKDYKLDEKLAKKFSSLGVKRTEDGDFELDSIYSEKMEKPEEAAELIFFLTDKEGYLKSKMADTKIGTEKEHLRRINLINKSKDRSTSKTNKISEDDPRNEFIVEVE